MKLKRKAERCSRRTKGGDLNLQYEKRDWCWGGTFKRMEQPGTPVAGTKHGGFSCRVGSDSTGGCLKDASRHIRGLKAAAATCKGVESTCALAAHIGHLGFLFFLHKHEVSLELDVFINCVSFNIRC